MNRTNRLPNCTITNVMKNAVWAVLNKSLSSCCVFPLNPSLYCVEILEIIHCTKTSKKVNPLHRHTVKTDLQDTFRHNSPCTKNK